MLRQNPGFALTAIVSIALAVGANSAIFSFQDALLFRPLPVENPSTLVTVNSRNPVGRFEGFSYPDFADVRDKTTSFDGLVAYRLIPAGISRDENSQPQFRVGMLATGNMFDLLGVKPHLGRGFLPDEDQLPGRNPVVVLTYDLWKNEFDGDPSIVGSTIRIGRAGGSEFTVIGVAPESFTGMDLVLRPAFIVPVMMGPQLLGQTDVMLRDRNTPGNADMFYVKGRLKSGVSLEAANADVSALAKTFEQMYPNTHRGRGAAVRTEIRSRLDAAPILGGVVAAVFGVMLVILLIACANVMNLMLTRGRSRAREIAIRLSLGANRARLIRQLMIESLMIAMAGGALGLLIAQRAVDIFSTWELPGDVSGGFSFELDSRVLLFTLAVSVISAVMFGLIPAFRSTKTDLTDALKSGGLSSARRRSFVKNGLVAVQIAGSIVLVMAAAQMYRNTSRALAANPGFSMDHRLTMRLDPEVAGYSPERAMQFYETLVDSVRGAPGVKSAALAGGLPFTTEALTARVAPEGYELPPGIDALTVRSDIVDEHYFQTLNMALLRGRGFTPSDQADAPRVAVVNEAFAQRFFGGNALHKRMWIGIDKDEVAVEVVGVSVTGKYQSAVEQPAPFIYLPLRQHSRPRMTLITETSGDAVAMAPALRTLIRSIDPNMPIFSVRTMEDVFERNGEAPIHIFNMVFSATALMGFFLAMIGLYSVVAYQVARRTREFGIRMALGAERSQVMKSLLKQAAVVAGIGMGIGLGLSIAIRPVLLAMLGRPTAGGAPSGFEPLLLVCLPLALMLITLAAAAIPARHALRIDPQQALRQD